jgi:hypothetical protein
MKAVITLESGRLPFVEVTDGRVRRTFETTPDILADLFAAVNGEEGPVGGWTVSPLLPPHTVFWAGRGLDECLVLDIPAGPAPWVVRGRETAATVIPLPRLLFLAIRRGEHISKTAVVAVADEGPLSPTTALYAYPLSNVYDNTTTCWTVPDRPYTRADVPALARMFLATPNNWDLYAARNQSGLDYRALIADLAQRDTFPTEWLVPLDLTWTQWITRFVPDAVVTDPT